VYAAREGEEFTHAALVLSGPVAQSTWRGGEIRNVDLFDVKGILTRVLGNRVSFRADKNDALALSLEVLWDGQPIGYAGQLWPSEARALDATAPVVFAEVNIDGVLRSEHDTARYREIPRFPSTARDIAMLAPLELSHEQVRATLTGANEALLESVELFDVFTDPSGEKVPADKKSVAYSLTYRSSERTLTADEVNAAHSRLKERLKTSLGVQLRE